MDTDKADANCTNWRELVLCSRKFARFASKSFFIRVHPWLKPVLLRVLITPLFPAILSPFTVRCENDLTHSKRCLY